MDEKEKEVAVESSCCIVMDGQEEKKKDDHSDEVDEEVKAEVKKDDHSDKADEEVEAEVKKNDYSDKVEDEVEAEVKKNDQRGRVDDEVKKDDHSDKADDEVEAEVIDVCGREWTFPLLEEAELEKKPERARGLYVYNNVFGVIPDSLRKFKNLKTLKVFSNELNLFPSSVGELVELEQIQVKLNESWGVGSLPPLKTLTSLKELHLSKTPPRPSAFSLSPHISCLGSLLRLSLCHLSISFLPSEIGSLKKLEELDLSFNKLKTLPNSIAELVSLKSLKVASNKLVELPLGISDLSRLTTVDASNNRLTSLQPLELFSMRALRKLNLQHNKLQDSCRIPPWISCNLEGNSTLAKDIIQGGTVSFCTEEEFSACIFEEKGNHSLEAKPEISLPGSSNKHVASAICSHQSRKAGWKRRQRKACQERLDSTRKLCTEDYQERENVGNVIESHTVPMPLSNDALYQPQETVEAPVKRHCSDMGVTSLVQDGSNACQDSGDVECKNGREIDPGTPLQRTERKVSPENSTGCKLLCSSNSVNTDCSNVISSSKFEVNMSKIPFPDLKENGQVDGCLKAKNDALPKTRRRHGVCIHNSKPCKRLRSLQECSRVSQRYSKESFCGVHDIMADGFYDAGQDRSFKPLRNFENETFCLDTREIILVDRERDEELDAIALSAQQVISGWKRFGQGSFENGYKIDDYQRASLLALFVSNCFGGSDKSLNISTMRRAVVGANVEIPFVCTCPINNNSNVTGLSDQAFESITVPGIDFLCEQSVRTVKEQYNSNVVPIGAIQYGVGHHRAILMKYLCDRADPPIPCELIRGYMDYTLHAWNAIIINKDRKWVRLIVDTCRPHDIRDEEDPEYFCRYIPLTRYLIPPPTDKDTIFERNSVWPCLHEEISCGPSGSVVQRCTLGRWTAAAKVRRLEVSISSQEQRLNFESNFLAEVRMLGALKKHPCIVDLYGHQISSSWVSLSDGMGESQVVQSIIAMEYVNGGSLESLLGKLAQEDKMCTTPKLALFIARDVACALTELHSKNIIHRDVKSKNVLIDLEVKRVDGSPVVKLCDFDLAVPLHSSSHTCCLAHHAVAPAEFCTGTPRWMAPEVVRAMHGPQQYGMEVDIWSFGCLILELLTLQIPYAEVSDIEIHHCLQMGQRPPFTRELDKYLSEWNDKVPARKEGIFPEENEDMIKLLADLFISCTEFDPSRRPTAKQAYGILSAVSGHTPMTSTK